MTEDARDRVIQAAMDLVDSGYFYVAVVDLEKAVRALRSLHADRGLRDPGTPGEQATGAEPAHGEDRNDREQP